jgi:hypothetical protein
MKEEFSPLVSLIKDLETALKSYRKSLKEENKESVVVEKEIHFLKISKTLLQLFGKNSKDPKISGLKKQTESIINAYKELRKPQPLRDDTAEIVFNSLEEDQGVYYDQQAIEDEIVRQRREEIIKLHNEMNGMNQLMTDFSDLVIDQGIKLEKVENELEVAEKTTERTIKDLKVARFWQKESNRKCCYILLLVLILLGAIGGILAGVILSK